MGVNFAPLFTQAQLEMAMGGADKLLQQIDKTGTGDLSSAACQAYIAEIQAAATGDVCSILQIAFDPSDPTFAGAAVVQLWGVTFGVYWTWHKATGGIAIPPEVKEARAQGEAALEKAAEGMRALGTNVEPASNAGAKTVSVDDTGKRILRKNMSGFC